VKPGGTFLLNTLWKGEELERNLPNHVKRTLARNHVKFYTIDAVSIAQELGLGNRTNTVLQAAFFKLSGVLPVDEAVQYMKDAITHSYFKKGDKVLNMNYAAVDRGLQSVEEIRVPDSWKDLPDEPLEQTEAAGVPDYVRDVLIPVNAQAGDKIPVSKFLSFADGVTEVETSKYEKRGIAVDVPQWLPDNCIGCKSCVMACPFGAVSVATTQVPVLMGDVRVGSQTKSFVLKCDLCVDRPGGPACAEACPTKGLTLVDEERLAELTAERARATIENEA